MQIAHRLSETLSFLATAALLLPTCARTTQDLRVTVKHRFPPLPRTTVTATRVRVDALVGRTTASRSNQLSLLSLDATRHLGASFGLNLRSDADLRAWALRRDGRLSFHIFVDPDEVDRATVALKGSLALHREELARIRALGASPARRAKLLAEAHRTLTGELAAGRILVPIRYRVSFPVSDGSRFLKTLARSIKRTKKDSRLWRRTATGPLPAAWSSFARYGVDLIVLNVADVEALLCRRRPGQVLCNGLGVLGRSTTQMELIELARQGLRRSSAPSLPPWFGRALATSDTVLSVVMVARNMAQYARAMILHRLIQACAGTTPKHWPVLLESGLKASRTPQLAADGADLYFRGFGLTLRSGGRTWQARWLTTSTGRALLAPVLSATSRVNLLAADAGDDRLVAPLQGFPKAGRSRRPFFSRPGATVLRELRQADPYTKQALILSGWPELLRFGRGRALILAYLARLRKAGHRSATLKRVGDDLVLNLR